MSNEKVMNLKDEIKRLKTDNFWFKILLFMQIVTMGILAVGLTKSDGKIITKTAEIADKAGIECAITTNTTLFGVVSKVKFVE